MGDWKVKVIVGIALFIVGLAGLSGYLPLGWEVAVEWTASTLLVFIGLAVAMYGFANVT